VTDDRGRAETRSRIGISRPESLLTAYRESPERRAARDLIFGSREAALGGLAGGSLSFFLASLAGPEDTPPVLVLTASEEEAEELIEELETFAGGARSFPAWESLFHPDSLPDGETYRERLETLLALVHRVPGTDPGIPLLGSVPEIPRFIVAPVHAAIQPVPGREEVRASLRRIAVGDRIDPTALAREFDARGLRRTTLVEKRGEFSLRGDIFDVFPHDGPHAVRIEFFGDTVEAIRSFRPENQKSIPGSEVSAREFHLPSRSLIFQECFRGRDGESLIFDHLPPDARVVVWEPPSVYERAAKIFHNLLGDEEAALASPAFFLRLRSRPGIEARSGPVPSAPGAMVLDFGTVERFRGAEIVRAVEHLGERLREGARVEVWCESAAEAERLVEILRDNRIEAGGALGVLVGRVRRGFAVGAVRALVLSSRELFNRQAVRRVRRRETPARPISSFLELSPGDHVVHLIHGVGRFRGAETFEKEGVLQEFLAVEFRDRVVVYVPVSKIDLVQKYIGSAGRAPILDKVGGASWSRKKEEVERAVADFASELLDVQALRSEKPGIAYPADTEWQRQFEASFPFEDTLDQVDATGAIKADMESPRPMDRLLCGDVGYGKTELAMRAAFKAANAGRQVAMLVPTTVLAEQHLRTFRERMAEFPLRIEALSRFRSGREQREIVEATAAGAVDILIGTHRLLSGDVVFEDLGLVIIDEEQRFGVVAKEKLKRFRTLIDILTMTATPIPRTLHMSLLGIRDISNLTTPPEGRSPIETEVIEFDRPRVRDIILRELNRDGQVYFVHNKVHDIGRIQWEIERLVPEARIEHAHGQMSEDQLEEIMVRFMEGQIDVLVSTTIIESGIDIPNVNTIFIDEADRYGLADLHQLRGRVGRGKHQAFCYLVLPEGRRVNADAQKRIGALREFAELGAGFRIAMRDLEIRGAGNILGPEQSGHISLVGYEMYCRLLEKAVKRLKDEEVREPVAVEVDLNLEAFIPDDFIPERAERLDLYRRISVQRDPEGIAEMAREIEDRYGEPPAPARRLLDLAELRALAAGRGIVAIARESGDRLVLRGGEAMKGLLDGAGRHVRVLDPRTALVSLEGTRPPAARHRAEGMTDEEVFRAALAWLRTGKLPEAPSPFAAIRARAVSRPRDG
jgi:transcription-repair coupling factor (superfamily II helicase)